MNHRMVEALMAGIAPVIRQFMEQAAAGFAERIGKLEGRSSERGEKGEPGEAGVAGKDGRDGIDGKDGAPGAAGDRGEKGEPGEAGVAGKDGTSVTIDDVRPMVEETVSKAVAAVPLLRDLDTEMLPDGKTVRFKFKRSDDTDEVHELAFAVRNGEKGEDGNAGKDGEPGTPGAPGERGAKGEPGDRGLQGEKGDPGRDGRDASDLSVVREMVADQVAKGLAAALATMSLSSPDDGRTMVVEIRAGDTVVKSEIITGAIIDRGVWREGGFAKGDGVSWGGSFFIAQRDTTAKPETSPDWRLAVKRGRDGKDGKAGDAGAPGPKGDRGEPGPRGYGG